MSDSETGYNSLVWAKCCGFRAPHSICSLIIPSVARDDGDNIGQENCK